MIPRILAIAATVASVSLGAHAQAFDSSTACEQAAQTAEAVYGLPTGLLAAIGRVESGRRDPATGYLRPWPYTLNANGVGSHFSDPLSALTAIAGLRSRGVASIDVGCFQINLLHHPHAFPTLSDAFVPHTNADYAARFLLELRQRTGDWVQAVMAYHSMTPGLGQAYWAQVQSNWKYTGGLAAVLPTQRTLGPVTSVAIKIWTPSPIGSAPSNIHLGSGESALPIITYLTN